MSCCWSPSGRNPALVDLALSFADARNKSDDLRQELTRVDGLKRDAEAMAASLAIDVANQRATQQQLEATIVRLQNKAAGKCLCYVPLFCSFGGSLNEANLVSLAAANSLRQKAESECLKMKEALEHQITNEGRAVHRSTSCLRRRAQLLPQHRLG